MIRGHVRRDRIVLTPARAGGRREREREGQGGANPEQSAALVVNKTESATNANPVYGNTLNGAVGSNGFRKNALWEKLCDRGIMLIRCLNREY